MPSRPRIHVRPREDLGMPRRTTLPPELRGVAASTHGVVTTADATKAGVSPGRMARLVRNGLLTRTGRGTFVLTEHLEQLSVWPAFALRSRAFLAACGSNEIGRASCRGRVEGPDDGVALVQRVLR